MNGHDNGYGYQEKHAQLDEDAFGPKGNIVSSFDAFRESLRSKKAVYMITTY
jgi:hypothetical protein